jgi:hypothetical protein
MKLQRVSKENMGANAKCPLYFNGFSDYTQLNTVSESSIRYVNKINTFEEYSEVPK